jgi:propane monooxygenase small subunit
MPPTTQEAAEQQDSAKAGAKTFAGSDSRKYNYFEPKGRKATLYEDVTVDVQPDPERYLIQDWILSFADGTPTYSETRTAIKSSDWHKYRARYHLYGWAARWNDSDDQQFHSDELFI